LMYAADAGLLATVQLLLLQGATVDQSALSLAEAPVVNGYRQVKWKKGRKKKDPLIGETDLTLPGEDLVGICDSHPADNDWENLFELNEPDEETGRRTVKRPRLSETRYSQLYKLQDDRAAVAAVLREAIARLPEPEVDGGDDGEGDGEGEGAPLIPPPPVGSGEDGSNAVVGESGADAAAADTGPLRTLTVDGHVQQGRYLVDDTGERDPEVLIATWLSDNGRDPVADRAEAVAAISDQLTAAQRHALYWTEGDGAQFVLEPLEQAQKDLDEAKAAQAEAQAALDGAKKKKAIKAAEEAVAKTTRLVKKAETKLEQLQAEPEPEPGDEDDDEEEEDNDEEAGGEGSAEPEPETETELEPERGEQVETAPPGDDVVVDVAPDVAPPPPPPEEEKSRKPWGQRGAAGKVEDVAEDDGEAMP
jgi:hypothetical protein